MSKDKTIKVPLKHLALVYLALTWLMTLIVIFTSELMIAITMAGITMGWFSVFVISEKMWRNP